MTAPGGRHLMAGTKCWRRPALFLVVYLLFDFMDPLAPGTGRVEVDESAETVEMATPPTGDFKLAAAPAVRVPTDPVVTARPRGPRALIEERAAPLGRPQPRSLAAFSSAPVQ